MKKRLFVFVVCVISMIGSFYGINNVISADTVTTTPFTLQPRDGTDGSRGTQFIFCTNNGKDTVWEVIQKIDTAFLLPFSPIGATQWYIPNKNQPRGELSETYNDSDYKRVIDEFNAIPRTELENKALIDSSAPAKMLDYNMVKDGGTLNLNKYHRKFYDTSLPTNMSTDAGYPSMRMLTLALNSGNPTGSGWYWELYLNTGDFNKGTLAANITQPLYFFSVVPYMELDLSKVVFAVNKDYSSGTYSSSEITSDTIAQLRVLDETITPPTIDQVWNYTKNRVITNHAIKEGNQIKLNFSHAPLGANQYVSILYRDRNKGIDYYERVTNDDSVNEFLLDTSSWEVGTYDIYFVVEDIQEKEHATASSALSAPYTLEVVDLHRISYQSSKSDGENYIFKEDTAALSVIGTTALTNGTIYPYTYEIQANGDDTWENFEIVDDSGSNVSSQDNMNVRIKQNAKALTADGNLPAGTYSFCISAKDGDNDPEVPKDNVTKVCTSFTVSQLTTDIWFDDANTTLKSIGEASVGWIETASTTPDDTQDLKVKYEVYGGNVGLIDIDSDSGAITYKGSNAFGKVTIKATVDDDKTTGNDNYIAKEAYKDIVIYRELDAVVTPHSASSDNEIPTFTTSDSNIKPNGVIGKIEGSLGTPDDLSTSGKTTYSYELKSVGNANFFSVDKNSGEIRTTSDLSALPNAYHITVIVKDQWSEIEKEITINVGMAKAEDLKFYENSTSNTVINAKTAKTTDTNVTVFATVKGSTNTNPVTYRIKDDSTNVITIHSNSGKIDMKGVGTVTIVAEKLGSSGQAPAYAELTFTVTAGEQEFIFTDSTLSNELPKTGDTYDTYSESYGKDKTFQLYTSGYPQGSEITYQLKADSVTDVIDVSSDGTVTILNASQTSDLGKVIVEAISRDPSGNYQDKTIEIPITITKANQTISFKEVTYATNGKGTVTPVIIAQDISSNAGGATVNDTDYYISVDSSISSSIAKTSDGKTISYNYTGEEGMDIPLHVIKQGNRNYNMAEADGKIHIMGPDENILIVTDVGDVTYGEPFTIRSLQDDSGSTNYQYTFIVDDTTYISNPTVNGNSATFDALKASGNNTITITVTRTADGEVPLTRKVQVTVLPKDIEITIDNQTKYKGEANPPLTYQEFTAELVTWNGIQDKIEPNDIKLSTTAKDHSPAGNYPIKGDSAYLNTTYPNYNFTFKEGTLEVKEDHIEDDWYHLEIDDGKGTAYNGQWTNQDVNIISDHDEYINISLDESTWEASQITVTKEGSYEQSFWLKKDSGATTSEKQETIKIDKTTPQVRGIKATDTSNKLQDIINQLSGGIFFKPSTAFEITTSDENGDLEVSGTESIAYRLYKQVDGNYGNPIKEDTLSVTNEKASITIGETSGTYKVCIIPKDKAGNEGVETCHEVTLKKINVDVDGDGETDFNDVDGDGCPDTNIKYQDDSGKWITINGDRNGDGIPDYNIDSDGDGKPDINIDVDGDGKPDINLVTLKEWKPTQCVTVNGEEYASGIEIKPETNIDSDGDGKPDVNIDTDGDGKPDLNTGIIKEWNPDTPVDLDGDGKPDYMTDSSIKGLNNIDTDKDGYPDLNIDLDNDGLPDLNINTDGKLDKPQTNIDSDGDGVPDINIDDNGDGIPDRNVMEIKTWNPQHNVTKDGKVIYDTMNISYQAINELEDNGIKVEKPDGSTFLPNMAIKVTDVTSDRKDEVINSASNLMSEDQEVKRVYEVNLFEDGVEVKPDGTLRIRIPVNEGITNPILIKQNSDGTYEKVNATIENGYLVYETDELGIVSIVGDKDSIDEPNVQGSYYPGDDVGGANTGDTTNLMLYVGISCMALGIIFLVLFKRKKVE